MDIEPKKLGRPSSYTQELADKLCEKLAQGKSLRTICEREEGHEQFPSIVTIFAWMRKHEDFLKQYTRAKEESTDALADEIMDIADNSTNDWMEIEKSKGRFVPLVDREHVERSKLRIESRKWIMAKMKPKKYGDKLDLSNNGKDFPRPILGYVPSNNSHKEDHGDVQASQSDSGGDISQQNSISTPLLDTLGSK